MLNKKVNKEKNSYCRRWRKIY